MKPCSSNTIAVTGLHGGPNPQPGCGVIRALRGSGHRIVGLIYDPLESGAHDASLADAVWTMPYLSMGATSWLDCLEERHAADPIDVLIPTLDAEIEMLLTQQNRLTKLGISCLLPDAVAFRRRSKTRLPELCLSAGCPHPTTHVARTASDLAWAARELGYPLLVKGRHYGAVPVSSEAGLYVAASAVSTVGGYPVVLQRQIQGEEYNVAGVGDGDGDLLGMVSLRKCVRSAEGKGLSGVTVRDPALERLTRRILRELKWRGPFELELIREETSGDYYVIEMNPRFPAWIAFSAALGCNLPAAALDLARNGFSLIPLTEVQAGKLFVRHSIEIVTDIMDLGVLSTTGILARDGASVGVNGARHATSN